MIRTKFSKVLYYGIYLIPTNVINLVNRLSEFQELISNLDQIK